MPPFIKVRTVSIAPCQLSSCSAMLLALALPWSFCCQMVCEGSGNLSCVSQRQIETWGGLDADQLSALQKQCAPSVFS